MGLIYKPNGEKATPDNTSLCADLWPKYLVKDILQTSVLEQASRISDLRRSCGVLPDKDTITIRRPVEFTVRDR